jgi:hypothetical protein
MMLPQASILASDFLSQNSTEDGTGMMSLGGRLGLVGLSGQPKMGHLCALLDLYPLAEEGELLELEGQAEDDSSDEYIGQDPQEDLVEVDGGSVACALHDPGMRGPVSGGFGSGIGRCGIDVGFGSGWGTRVRNPRMLRTSRQEVLRRGMTAPISCEVKHTCSTLLHPPRCGELHPYPPLRSAQIHTIDTEFFLAQDVPTSDTQLSTTFRNYRTPFPDHQNRLYHIVEVLSMISNSCAHPYIHHRILDFSAVPW